MLFIHQRLQLIKSKNGSPLFNRYSSEVQEITLYIDSYIVSIQKQIDTTFGNAKLSKLSKNDAFIVGKYNNKELIDTLKYCLAYIEKRPRTNITQEKYLAGLSETLSSTSEYCINYVTQCENRINEINMGKMKSAKYNTNNLKLLKDQVTTFYECLYKNVCQYLGTNR